MASSVRFNDEVSVEETHPEPTIEEAPVFIAPPTDFQTYSRVDDELERHGLHLPGRREHKIRFHGKQLAPRSDQVRKKNRKARPDSLKSTLEKFSGKVHLVLSVCDPASHDWRTAPVTFDQLKNNDRDVWEEIRRAYREELQKSWRRWLFFRKLKYIVPIKYSHNGVPTRHKPADYLDSRVLLHAYHHPEHIRPDKVWIGWLVHLKNSGDPGKTYGLEFIEGLWVEKLFWAAVIGTLALIIPSIVWPLKGGKIGDVYTMLGFIENWFAILIALIAIYYTAIISEI